ncbi:MAG: MobF family relaxase, partial [Thermoplasmata archaeon]
MISHSVVKNGKTKKAGDVAEYLLTDIETGNTTADINTYYNENSKAKLFEYASDGITQMIKQNNLQTTADKIAFFSSRQRVGYDFTLSFAKDISLLAEFDDSINNILKDVVKHTVRLMSDDVYTREQTRKENIYKKKFVKADALFQVFHHHTSRELDPQTHYHIFISNQVLYQGKLLSLSAERLVENKFYYDILAQYQLAERLQSKGYNAYLDGKAQLRTSFDNNLIKMFSKRKHQIEEKAKELYGISDITKLSREQLKAIVLSTRKEKEKDIDIDTLQAMWLDDLSKLGYDNIDDFFNTLKRKYDNELSEQDLETAYNEALKENEEKRGLFRYEDITKDYLVNLSRISQEQNKKLPRLDIVMDYLDRKIKTLYKIDTISNTNMKQTLYTTKKYFHIEKEAFNTLLELSEIPHQLADIKTIQTVISIYEIRNGFNLTDEQKNAIYNVLHGASLSVINGHAGAGKTTSAEIISDVAKRKNLNIIALAPTGKASDELGKALKTDKAKTIDSFLLQDEYKEIDSNTIIFVDEAGMVDIYNMSELIKIAKQTGAKLVLQGDWKQLKPVDAGDLYTDIYNKLKKDNSLALTELRTIRRQKIEEYRDIATHLSEKEFQQAFDMMLKHRRKYFSIYDNNNIIQEFMQDPKDTLIVASTNDIKDELNTLIRKELMKESESEKEIEVRQIINDINSLDDLEIGYECEINKKRYTIKAINMYNNHIVLAPIETPDRDKRGRKKQEI